MPICQGPGCHFGGRALLVIAGTRVGVMNRARP